ncbi:MAG: ribonuclease HIII, partial [bacterium]|nr:ribonuclease HIII [bacterium]
IEGVGYKVHVYTSKKVMIQGEMAKEEATMWAELFDLPMDFLSVPNNPTDKVTSSVTKISYDRSKNHFGSDEVGTGDFFGPVVVVCAYVTIDQQQTLLDLGVKDSKLLTDEAIIKIASTLRSIVPYWSVVLPNPKYNEMITKGYNQNKLKAYLHNHALRKALQEHKSTVDLCVVDAFCNKEQYFSYLTDYPFVVRNIELVEKAESKYLAVAAASIIARDEFIHQMNAISQTLGIVLPYGASAIVDLIGKRIALEKGFGVFDNIAKTHFKNMDKIKTMMK